MERPLRIIRKMIATYFTVFHFKSPFPILPSILKHFQVYYHSYILRAVLVYMTLKGRYSLFSSNTYQVIAFFFLPQPLSFQIQTSLFQEVK